MKKTMIFVVLLSFVFACDDTNPPMKSTGERLFKTNDPNRLYFKNIRSIKYDLKEEPTYRMDYYRLRSLINVSKRPLILPVLVDNWLQSEAYFLLETLNIPDNFDWKIKWKGEGDTGILELKGENELAHYKAGQEIAEFLKKGYELSIEFPNKAPMLLLNDPLDRLNYLVVYRDFLALTK